MTWKRSVLVVANVTATSDLLLNALKLRAEHEPVSFTLVVPATPFGGGKEAARETLNVALDRLRSAGLQADGKIGDGDPVVAVSEAWDPGGLTRWSSRLSRWGSRNGSTPGSPSGSPS